MNKVFFFTETNFNSANVTKKLAYVPLFWMDNANKHLSLSHYSDVSQKWMGKLIEAKIVQKGHQLPELTNRHMKMNPFVCILMAC